MSIDIKISKHIKINTTYKAKISGRQLIDEFLKNHPEIDKNADFNYSSYSYDDADLADTDIYIEWEVENNEYENKF